jgi:hypothetical protein
MAPFCNGESMLHIFTCLCVLSLASCSEGRRELSAFKSNCLGGVEKQLIGEKCVIMNLISSTLHLILSLYLHKEDEMGGTSGTHGE